MASVPNFALPKPLKSWKGEVSLISDPLNLIITGVGGQGTVLSSKIVAIAGWKEGYRCTVGEVYGLSQRGGSVVSHVRISMEHQLPPLIPKGKVHCILGFEPMEVLRQLCLLGGPQTKVVMNQKPIYPLGFMGGRIKYPPGEKILEDIKGLIGNVRIIDVDKIVEELGSEKALNLVMIGSLVGIGLLPFKAETFEDVIDLLFEGNDKALNLRAFKMGIYR